MKEYLKDGKKFTMYGWKEVHLKHDPEEKKDDVIESETSVALPGKSTWGALIAKIYEINPLVCQYCGGEMKVVAVIVDSVEVKKILKHLVKRLKSPPGVCLEGFDLVS